MPRLLSVIASMFTGAAYQQWRHKSPTWWAQRVTWYPDGCFGPYRSAQEGYSRRELAADAAVHVVGVSMGCVGALLMLERVADPACPAAVRLGLGVYACSLLAMLCCGMQYLVMMCFDFSVTMPACDSHSDCEFR